MAGKIGLTIEDFEAFQSKLTSLQEAVNGEMDNIQATAEEVQSTWEGQASTDFRTKFVDWKTRNMSQFNEIMEEVQTALTNYKTMMIEQDNTSF